MDFNVVVLSGRLAAPPELRVFESGLRLVRYLITVRADEPRRRVDVVPVTLWEPSDDVLLSGPPGRAKDLGGRFSPTAVLVEPGWPAQPPGDRRRTDPTSPRRWRSDRDGIRVESKTPGNRRVRSGYAGALMPRIATASSSELAAAAAVRIAEEGGNAVDGAVASALVSMITEPGVCALGGGGFVTIWIPGSEPVTIDGYIEMPGRGLPRDRFGQGAFDVTMAYGGGITTTIGHGSVGTPGALAALGLASARYGRIPWPLLVEPAYELARDGFPLSQPSSSYLQFSHEVVFGWHEPSRAALHREDGSLIPEGGTGPGASPRRDLPGDRRAGSPGFVRG